MTCPDCKNTGATIASHVRYADGSGASNVRMRCTRCAGSGSVPDAMAEWMAVGREMHDRRVAAGRTLREEAARLGISCVELSKMEFGKVRPDSALPKSGGDRDDTNGELKQDGGR